MTHNHMAIDWVRLTTCLCPDWGEFDKLETQMEFPLCESFTTVSGEASLSFQGIPCAQATQEKCAKFIAQCLAHSGQKEKPVLSNERCAVAPQKIHTTLGCRWGGPGTPHIQAGAQQTHDPPRAVRAERWRFWQPGCLHPSVGPRKSWPFGCVLHQAVCGLGPHVPPQLACCVGTTYNMWWLGPSARPSDTWKSSDISLVKGPPHEDGHHTKD